jgi:hypothetical protein
MNLSLGNTANHTTLTTDLLQFIRQLPAGNQLLGIAT